MNSIIEESLSRSCCSYEDYRKIVSAELSQGRVTGEQHSKDLIHYTLLNETRMNRLEKTISIQEQISIKLKALKGDYIWLVISEGWCGDAAQLLPIICKMERRTDKIDMKIVFRDQHPDLMGLFLTNGSKSIPKLIVLDRETKKVTADWGPRPQPAAEIIKRHKAEFGIIDETALTELQLWYLRDKGFTTQKELTELMVAVDSAKIQNR